MVHKGCHLHLIPEQQNIHHLPSTFTFQGCSHVAVSPTRDGTTYGILKLAQMGIIDRK